MARPPRLPFLQWLLLVFWKVLILSPLTESKEHRKEQSWLRVLCQGEPHRCSPLALEPGLSKSRAVPAYSQALHADCR